MLEWCMLCQPQLADPIYRRMSIRDNRLLLDRLDVLDPRADCSPTILSAFCRLQKMKH
jgi:hypothetical protein